MHYEIWLAAHRGKVVHPLELVGALSSNYKFPFAKYSTLEEKGIVEPRSYKNGEVTSIIVLHTHRGENIPTIEKHLRLERSSIDPELIKIFNERDGLSYYLTRLSHRAIEKLVENKYARVAEDGKIHLCSRGIRRVLAIQ